MAERRRGTVLVVDDQEAIRVIAERMLSRAGYAVVCCASAEEALETLAASGAAVDVDVLLSDVHLEGINGPALAAEVRRRRPAVRVVLMSGGPQHEAEDAGMPAGTRFLSKPYTREALVAAVEAAHRAPPGS